MIYGLSKPLEGFLDRLSKEVNGADLEMYQSSDHVGILAPDQRSRDKILRLV